MTALPSSLRGIPHRRPHAETQHEREQAEALSNFTTAEDALHSLILTPEQIHEMNEKIAARRVEFLQRIRNLNEAVNTSDQTGKE